MKPIASPLAILDSSLIGLDYKFIHPKKGDKGDPRKYFSEYALDIDFNLNQVENFYQVYIKASINTDEKKLPGYSMVAEVICIFERNEDVELSDQELNGIEGISTIYISLNSLRGIVSQLTAMSPAGKYILPSIDLNDLVKRKKTEIGEAGEKRQAVIPKKSIKTKIK